MRKVKLWVLEHQNTLSLVVAIVGFIFYLYRLWGYSHTLLSSIWDEGMYLYKGAMFASGQYTPFEDFGLWTNQLPVSYFVPGFFQTLFGAGIRTGRLYAFLLGALTLVGVWLAARRQGNRWLAAGIVWIFALNTGWLKSYSMVLSQGLVSFFFAWMLFFMFGKEKRSWELGMAAFLASLAGLTRINVLPVVFLFVLYVFWQYGWKDGLIAAAAGVLPIVVVHLAYWPDILKIWAYWIPENIFPAITQFCSPHREIFVPDDFSWLDFSVWVHDPKHLAWEGVSSLVRALRANFSVIVGVVAALLLWPRQADWQSEDQRKRSVFLLVTYLAMFGIHAWAALGGHTCRFVCFSGYMLFFNVFGLLLLVSVGDVLRARLGFSGQVLVFVLVALAFAAFVMDYQPEYKPLRKFFVYDVFHAEIDRMQGQTTRQQPETQPFWRFMEERFGFSRYPYLRFMLFNDLAAVLMRWGSVVLYTLLPVVGWWILRKRVQLKIDLGIFQLLSLMGVAVFMSPYPFLSQPLDFEACEVSVLDRYEEVGADLAAEIEPGAQLFWYLKSDVLLLYLPDREVFLPQTNFRYTFAKDSTIPEDILLQFGWWNMSIGEEWLQQTDYIVMDYKNYKNDQLWGWGERVEQGELNIVLITKAAELCLGAKSEIIVLKTQNLP